MTTHPQWCFRHRTATNDSVAGIILELRSQVLRRRHASQCVFSTSANTLQTSWRYSVLTKQCTPACCSNSGSNYLYFLTAHTKNVFKFTAGRRESFEMGERSVLLWVLAVLSIYWATRGNSYTVIIFCSYMDVMFKLRQEKYLILGLLSSIHFHRISNLREGWFPLLHKTLRHKINIYRKPFNRLWKNRKAQRCRQVGEQATSYTLHGKKPAGQVKVGDDPRKEILHLSARPQSSKSRTWSLSFRFFNQSFDSISATCSTYFNRPLRADLP
jgi:hypothetical protein